jgi:hypothetical protein
MWRGPGAEGTPPRFINVRNEDVVPQIARTRASLWALIVLGIDQLGPGHPAFGTLDSLQDHARAVGALVEQAEASLAVLAKVPVRQLRGMLLDLNLDASSRDPHTCAARLRDHIARCGEVAAPPVRARIGGETTLLRV